MSKGPEAASEERSLPYNPVEWSRRLDKAREARARILAERRGAAETAEPTPYRLHAPLASHGADAAVPDALSSSQPARAPGHRVSILRALGFLFGLAVATLLGHLLLAGIG